MNLQAQLAIVCLVYSMISVVLAPFGAHSVSVTCKQDDMEVSAQIGQHSHICFFLSVHPCNAEHDGAYSCQESAICSVANVTLGLQTSLPVNKR